MKTFRNIDEYISLFEPNVQEMLQSIRTTIRETAPQGAEVISYNMPALKLKGVLVYFAANKHHIGFYPTASPIRIFEKELLQYKTSKGAIQFPLDKPLPIELIRKIVTFRVQEDLEKSLQKNKKKT